MVSPSEYQLYMQVDTNTRGHQQRFYFRVKNTKANRKYIFKIMNFTKPGLTNSGNDGSKSKTNLQNENDINASKCDTDLKYHKKGEHL